MPEKRDEVQQTQSAEEVEQAQEESAPAAEEKQADLANQEGNYAGGTPGGASESQQPDSKQSTLPGSNVELPDLDPETARAVTPLAATPVNPGDSYDDDARGKPEDAEDGGDAA